MPDVLVRSTLLASSRDGLSAEGLLEAYESRLGPAWTDGIRLDTMITQWLPMNHAIAHYRAIDALGLSEAETLALGNVAARRLNGTLWGTLAKAAKHGGVTPWTVLNRSERFGGGSISTT
ncbi:MAG: hypothetical protein AB8I08_35325 [Sandaracinaceae bacterium]